MLPLDDEPDISPQINIVSMIDIIFTILAFFIVSSLYLTRSEGLSVNLPQATTTQPQKSTQITVTLDAEGKVFLNRQPTAVTQLQGAITQLIQEHQNPIVVLNADESVNHGQVIQVMDQLRQVRGAKLAISTRKVSPKMP